VGTVGYTQEGWRYLIGHMIDLPEPTVETITSYLAAHFPETSDRRPTLVPGDAVVTFKEWVVPTLATSTAETTIRRLALTSDGRVWYVDSSRGYLGRLDPNTGEFKTWPSPSGRGSHPYAIEVVDDVIWYNESNQRPDALVRFDPKTERFQSWAIPSGVGIIRHMRVIPTATSRSIRAARTRWGWR
jgi:hypothetical protein